MATSTFSTKVNRNDGSGWEPWGSLLTKEEAQAQAKEHRAWSAKNALGWKFKVVEIVEKASKPSISRHPLHLANLLNGVR